jgi:hypothetical protein
MAIKQQAIDEATRSHVRVYDDLIPQYLQDYFELTILGRSGENQIHPAIQFKCKYEDTAVDDSGRAPMSFYHVLKSSAENSEHFENFFEIPRLFCRAHDLVLREVLVARIYLITPQKTTLTHYKPHIDFGFPHTVLLYYVNDADGNTVFVDDQEKVYREVEPRKGRLLAFDGALYHGGGVPQRSPRCVVNYNIICQPRNARA